MQVIAKAVQDQMAGSSWIRKMFEKGIELKKQFGADRVFDFSLGNPDIPPPARAAEALRGLAERVAQPFGMGYCPNAGLPEFREALAAFLTAQQRAPVQPGHVVVTCGAAGALTSFFRAVLEPGDEVLCPAPYFVEYGSYCGHFGGVLKAVPSLPPGFQPDLAALEAAVTERTRVLLINSPNNPTGCVYSQATLDRLAALVNRVNAARTGGRPLFLLSDEPYRFLAYDGAEVPPVLPLSPFALALGSFSKNLSMAGERVGYLAASPAMPDVGLLISAVTLTNRTLGFVNAPVLGQRLAMALLNEGVDVAVYARRRRLMADVLTAAGIRFAMPQGAFYFFPEAPGGDDQAFVQALLAQNVLAVPGAGFGFPGHFRLSFSVEEQVIERSAPGFKAAAERTAGNR
ncbi:MAG: pyridoxal phosphate-dependent aminotransferase [Verrucomicrobiota bacterium]|jgi:aspartate aminotransferase|nr:pyridoxal phosphate-dependent aminotransferase [Verrucomicrobiota bacterium]